MAVPTLSRRTDPAHGPAPAGEPVAATASERALLAASAAVALVAAIARLHNAVAFPAIHDWDAGGHALNVVDLLDGRWPDVRSWGGAHPPLYYLLSAAAWIVGPASVPVHVEMRLLSIGAWFATVGVVWWWLRPRAGEVDAAVVAALLLGVPGLTIASGMMTNDALCALFVTATLVRLLRSPDDPPTAREAAVTGVLAGLAALSKATGVAAVGIAAGVYAWRSRRHPAAGLRALAALGLASAAVTGVHYARLFHDVEGSAYAILATRATSHEKEAIATVVNAIARDTTTASSFASLLHTAIWGDPTAVFLPRGLEEHALSRAVWIAGLLVMALGLAGAVRLLSSPQRLRPVALLLVFGVSYAAALVPHALDRPYIVLTKTNYLLPEALPVAALLAAGLGWLGGGWRTAARATVLAIAGAGTGLTVHGWWEPAAPVSRPLDGRDGSRSGAVAAVERYVGHRVDDPVRAVAALAPAVHLAHDLRLARILDLPPLPADALDSEAERSLELARARVAWLELYNLVPWFQPISGALDVHVLDAAERDGAARVRVRIAATEAGPPAAGDIGLWPFQPFEQVFTLEAADGIWRIVAVEQTGVVNENTLQAFVAHPTRAGFERLRVLGWKPPWERAVAAVLGRTP